MTSESVTIVEDIKEDIPEEIEEFVRLSRLGNFKEGNWVYESVLQPHVKLFPAAAEYADFLLEQGSYGLLEDFLKNTLDSVESGDFAFEKNEILLFRLLKALANMHTCGNLRDAVEEARSVWTRLPKTKPERPDEVEVHIFEIYLRIVTFAWQNSSWLRSEDTQPPWVDPTSERPWGGFRQLCLDLYNYGRGWESQKVMRLLFTVLPREEASKLCEESIGAINMKEGDSKDEEPVLIADLSTFNACIRHIADQKGTLDDLATLSKAESWVSKAERLSEKIQDNEPDAPDGRPFFELVTAGLQVIRLRQHSEYAPVSEYYTVLEEAARKVSDLSVQAESLWARHMLENKGSIPDQDAFGKLRDLQVNKMRDSLGYVKHIGQSLQLYLRDNRDKGHQTIVPEAYLEPSPAQNHTFNAPKLIEQYLENRVELGQLRKKNYEVDVAKAELQTFYQSSMRSSVPLHGAVEANNIEQVRLLSASDPVNERSTDGSTALHHAVQRCRSLNITTLLLERNADPDLQRSGDGYAALHVLVSTSYRIDAAVIEFLNKLIAYGADIHLRAFENESVVGLAACQNQAAPIRRLLDLGADPNSPFMTYRDPYRGTRSALGIASWHAHIETMKVLIDAGADVNHNDFGQTPLLEIACSRGASTDFNRYVEGAKLLLDAGADINCTYHSSTPLTRAVYNGNLGLVELLIAKGADPNARSENQSCIGIAREQGHENIAQYLAGLGVEDS